MSVFRYVQKTPCNYKWAGNKYYTIYNIIFTIFCFDYEWQSDESHDLAGQKMKIMIPRSPSSVISIGPFQMFTLSCNGILGAFVQLIWKLCILSRQNLTFYVNKRKLQHFEVYHLYFTSRL